MEPHSSIRRRETPVKRKREPLTPLDARIRPGPNPKLELARRLWDLGMSDMTANPSKTVVLAPPLIVTEGELDEGIRILDQALEVVDRHCR
ncbi:MAG: hypothetical protein JW940_32080 [Polyangiaceae bacterium]|nr:hypothetical protein [Polyangiaceae bacterium]